MHEKCTKSAKNSSDTIQSAQKRFKKTFLELRNYMLKRASHCPGTYLASLLKHQPRHLAMAPPLVQFLAKSPDATPKHFEGLEKVFQKPRS